MLSIMMILGLAACGSVATGSGADDAGAAAESSSESSSQPSNPSARPGGAAVPEELNFTAETIEGASFGGPSLAGKDAILWFWAPWCTECRREAPFVATSQSENPEVRFVGVAGLGENSDMRDFVADYDVSGFEHLEDVDGSLWERFGVVQQPAYAFVDDTGKIEVYRGALGEDGIAERVAALTGN